MFSFADFVKATTTTEGTGDITLGSSPTGFRSFAQGFADQDVMTVLVVDNPSAPVQWEVFEATYNDLATDTLTRGTLRSSSTGSRINFSAGTKTVVPAPSALFYDLIAQAINANIDATGSSGAYAVTTPAGLAPTRGYRITFKANHANLAGTCTLNPDGDGQKNIILADGRTPYQAAIRPGGIYTVEYDGTNFQLLNPTPLNLNQTYATTGSGGSYVVASANGITPYDGYFISIEPNHDSPSGGITLNVDSTGAQSIVITDGSTPHAGAMVSGGKHILMYDGTNFQLLNPSSNSGLEYIDGGTVSGATSLDITDLSTSSYSAYKLIIRNVLLATGGGSIYIRTSTDNGSSFDSGATNYSDARLIFVVTGSVTGAGSNGASNITLAANVGNSSASGENLQGELTIFHQTLPSVNGFLHNKNDSGGNFTLWHSAGERNTLGDANAIRLYGDSNISLDWALYGMRSA